MLGFTRHPKHLQATTDSEVAVTETVTGLDIAQTAAILDHATALEAAAAELRKAVTEDNLLQVPVITGTVRVKNRILYRALQHAIEAHRYSLQTAEDDDLLG